MLLHVAFESRSFDKCIEYCIKYLSTKGYQFVGGHIPDKQYVRMNLRKNNQLYRFKITSSNIVEEF